jgi:glycerol transport system ATP-binding protein
MSYGTDNTANNGEGRKAAMLELAGVRLHPQVPEEEGFDQVFSPGEISVVLGANQSGKTDLCRLIAGLNTQARGQVVLDGVDLSGFGPRQRSVGMVYQAFINYPNLSVAENIASPLKAKGASRDEIANRVAELAAKLQIGDLLSRLPEELSGGQQQRLAIARALAKDARVLLLDEPLVNLDFKLREALEVELRELLQASNTVVIYTSSDPRDAFSLGDQLVLLAKGEKIQAGSPISVYRDPASMVAMELLADPAVNRFEYGGAMCAVRPEHVSVSNEISESSETNQRLRFSMLVSGSETSGDESFVHGRVDEHEWVVRARGMLQVSPGQQLNLLAREQDVVRF